MTDRQTTRARKFLAAGYIFMGGHDSLAVEVFKTLARANPDFTMADLALPGDEEPPIQLVQ
ncbi:MAG: hypothetical protein AB1505_36585, partial [Candidatus Latescibacterota bacterium]